MKKLLTLLAALGITVAVSTGCSGGGNDTSSKTSNEASSTASTETNTADAKTASGDADADSGETITLEVQYPYGEIYDKLQKKLAADFEAKHPNIKIKFRSSYENYEDASQKVMRESITKTMPDVTFQGLNRILPLYERKIAVPLNQFITDTDKTEGGLAESMLSPGRFGGKTYGLPFAVSLPIAYYNMDLLKEAGADGTIPKTWDEIFALANKVNAVDGKKGMFYVWDMTGNWFWLAPVMSQGGKILDNGKVAFNSEQGKWAINTIARMNTEANMPFYKQTAARKSFIAGNIGIYLSSTSDVQNIMDAIDGRFEMVTGPFPDVRENGKLPAGGAAAIMLAQDPKRQQAAWKYIQYITGPVGNQQIAHFTGYMAPNPKASEQLIADGLYEDKPNHKTALTALPFMDTWVAFPGENGLKITDTIKDHLESVVNGERSGEPEAVLQDMEKDVNDLLPQ